MAKTLLQTRSPLDGFDHDFAGTRLREVTPLALVAIAEPMRGKAKLKAAVKSAYGCAMPSATKSVLSKDGKTRIVSMQPDQYFALFETKNPDAEGLVRKALGDAGYYTDQTHSWTAVELSGPKALEALERICPIDLHHSVFPLNASARTTMEHMGATIIRTGKESYLLMSASSSAISFLHAVETSVKYVL